MENHRTTIGKPWENGGLMGFNVCLLFFFNGILWELPYGDLLQLANLNMAIEMISFSSKMEYLSIAMCHFKRLPEGIHS